MKWRRANGIDELLSTDEWELPAELKEQHKVQLVALKGQIQPVWYIPVGTANFKGNVFIFVPKLILLDHVCSKNKALFVLLYIFQLLILSIRNLVIVFIMSFLISNLSKVKPATSEA